MVRHQVVADVLTLLTLWPNALMLTRGEPLWVAPSLLLDAVDGAVARMDPSPDPRLSAIGAWLDSVMDFLTAVCFCCALRDRALPALCAVFLLGCAARLAGFVLRPAFFRSELRDVETGEVLVAYRGMSVPLAQLLLCLFALAAPSARLDGPLVLFTGLLFFRPLVCHKWWVEPRARARARATGAAARPSGAAGAVRPPQTPRGPRTPRWRRAAPP